MPKSGGQVYRLRQKEELFFKLGILFGPLIHLVGQPYRYEDWERSETLARFFDQYPELIGEF